MRMTTVPIALAAALAVVLSPAAAMADPAAASDRVDVAFDALSQGHTVDAVDQLRRSDAVKAGDPAALINLGTAYARQGRIAEARAAYRAAMASDTRYDLELSDGSWSDSREAAKMALDKLETKGGISPG
jgi:Tfp pilus assembly protein PilF